MNRFFVNRLYIMLPAQIISDCSKFLYSLKILEFLNSVVQLYNEFSSSRSQNLHDSEKSVIPILIFQFSLNKMIMCSGFMFL